MCQARPRRRATPRIRFALLRVFKLRSPAPPESESHPLRFMKNPRSFQLSKLKRARVFSFSEMVASWRGGAQCVKRVHVAAPRRESASLCYASSSFGHRLRRRANLTLSAS